VPIDLSVRRAPSRTADVLAAARLLTKSAVYVGVASTTTAREPEPGEPTPPNNATIAWAMEHGVPDQNVPARPFMRPGIANVRAQLTARLRLAARAAYTLGTAGVLQQLNAVGLIGQRGMQQKITDGPFAPLAEATVRARIDRRKSKSYRAKKHAAVDANLAAGLDPEAGLFKPLIDTGSLRKAITYVIRGR